VTGAREQRAELAAHQTRTEDGDAHLVILSRIASPDLR
jgi:hypothetical protein